MTKLDQLKLLAECARMFSSSYVCPSSPRDFGHWWKIVKYSHMKGFLYVGFDNGTIDLAAVGYRVPEMTDGLGDEIPAEEQGEILYVPLLVSKSNDKLKPLRMLRYYLSNNQDVKTLAYHYRGTEKLKRFRLRSQNGQVKITQTA